MKGWNRADALPLHQLGSIWGGITDDLKYNDVREI